MKNSKLFIHYALQAILFVLILTVGLSVFLIKDEDLLKLFLNKAEIELFISKLNPDFSKDFNILKFWLHSGIFFFSIFAALSFWAVAGYVDRKHREEASLSGTTIDSIDKIDYLWFVYAMLSWILLSIISVLRDIDKLPEKFEFLRQSISVVNTMFFMLGLTCLNIDFSKLSKSGIEGVLAKIWEKITINRKKYQRYIVLISVFTILIDMISYQRIEGRIDAVFLSLLCAFMLGSGLFLVFKCRSLPELSYLAFGNALLFYFAQLLLHFNNEKSLILTLSTTLCTWLYIVFLTILLFSLVLSWLGWQKIDLLEKVNNELSEKQKDLEIRNTELHNTNELNQAFVSIVSGAMTRNYMEQLLVATAERLEKEGIFDYFFGIAVWNDDRSLVHFPYYEYMPAQPFRDYTTPPEETYVGYCLRNNCEVMEPNIEQSENAFRNARRGRNKTIAPDANSLCYFPIRNKHGEAFGALTVQSRRINPAYTDTQLNLLRSIAKLFGKVLIPEDTFIDPEKSFLRSAIKKNDQMYNFGLEAKQAIRPKEYNLLDELMQWSKEDTDSFFKLKVEGFYRERHPINHLMKGLCHGNFSCGSVLLALTFAYKDTSEENKPGYQVVKEIWNEIFIQWQKDEDYFEDFFRGKDGRKEDLEEQFCAVSEFFKSVVYQKDAPPKTPNLLNCTFEFEQQTIAFEFGIKDPKGLEQNLAMNRTNLFERGTEGLNHDLSRHIVVLESVVLVGGDFTYNIDNKSLLTTFSL